MTSSSVTRRLFAGGVRIRIENHRPAARRVDTVAHRRRTLAEAVEVAVLELDARGGRTIRNEAQLHFRDQIGLVLELGVELPGEHEPRRRVPGQHPAEVAFGAVGSALEPAATGPRLDDQSLGLDLADVVALRPPRADAAREHLEGA